MPLMMNLVNEVLPKKWTSVIKHADEDLLRGLKDVKTRTNFDEVTGDGFELLNFAENRNMGGDVFNNTYAALYVDGKFQRCKLISCSITSTLLSGDFGTGGVELCLNVINVDEDKFNMEWGKYNEQFLRQNEQDEC